MTSKAPSSRALIAAFEPFSVMELTIITGRGLAIMSFCKKVRPSIPGISTSRVITSGL
ncbi:MAG: hypothetical protein BWY23_02627 [Spirochaetes bacterium ADurb.Bin218]|nr:MAG: hypothetical protein BWY23_02627 [Spirochaetes bacterium ADurb.Bin218]